MSLTITNIPAIMRSHRWENGARLMETWFARPIAIAPAYGPPETATIRMDAWVLTFPRAKQVYDQLMREKIWANAAAQREIATMLRRQGVLTPGSRSFGNLTRAVPLQDADYINYRVVNFGLSNLDDLSAALGNFAFRVLVSGAVAAASGGSGYQVTITEVGVYIRDSYDFNGEQFLGYWDDSDNTVSMFNPLSGTSVSNSDFRDWRSRNGRGGDFLVFSDIKRTTLTTPDTFIVR
jgi:uncharacterized protein DUF6402